MKDLFIFSDWLKKWGKSSQFLFRKTTKIIALAFKWNKNIKLEQLSYFREWRFDNSYLIIHYKFRNAIWYQLKTIKRINSLQPIILKLENLTENKIEFIVYGFFRKKIYLIDTSKTEKLTTENFKSEIQNINIIDKIASAFTLNLSKPVLCNQNINLKQNVLETNIAPIEINLNNYSQKEYI